MNTIQEIAASNGNGCVDRILMLKNLKGISQANDGIRAIVELLREINIYEDIDLGYLEKFRKPFFTGSFLGAIAELNVCIEKYQDQLLTEQETLDSLLITPMEEADHNEKRDDEGVNEIFHHRGPGLAGNHHYQTTGDRTGRTNPEKNSRHA